MNFKNKAREEGRTHGGTESDSN